MSVYNVILISIASIVLYLISYILAKTKLITLIIHRRIWNYILLVSGLITLILGFLLTLQADLGIRINLPINMIFWHVEAGIAMSIIAIIHILWHWRYFIKKTKISES
jgi:hypothetical protein